MVRNLSANLAALAITRLIAPQFPNIARGQEYELLDWLSNITFPAEERLADAQYAQILYEEVVRRVLSFGVSFKSLGYG
jgi:guanine deaminase